MDCELVFVFSVLAFLHVQFFEFSVRISKKWTAQVIDLPLVTTAVPSLSESHSQGISGSKPVHNILSFYLMFFLFFLFNKSKKAFYPSHSTFQEPKYPIQI